MQTLLFYVLKQLAADEQKLNDRVKRVRKLINKRFGKKEETDVG